MLGLCLGPYDNDNGIDPPELLQIDRDIEAEKICRKFSELLEKKKRLEESQNESESSKKIIQEKEQDRAG